jgi:hypothetical protein
MTVDSRVATSYRGSVASEAMLLGLPESTIKAGQEALRHLVSAHDSNAIAFDKHVPVGTAVSATSVQGTLSPQVSGPSV